MRGDTTLNDKRVNDIMTRQGGAEAGLFLLPENDALQVEWILYDPSGGNAHPEHILLSGKIVGI